MGALYHSNQGFIQPPLFVLSKVCKHCDPPTEKPIEEFDRDKTKPDGRATMCKACAHERQRKRWAVLHPPKDLKEQVELTPEQAQKRERQHAANRKYRLNNAEKERERKRAYREANQERINEQQNAEYRAAVEVYRSKNPLPVVREGYKVCATCQEEKPHGSFYRVGANNDGYDYYCKECKDRASGRKHIGKIRNRRGVIVTDGYKWCHTCGSEQPLSEFWPDQTKRDGHNPRCKHCEKTYQHTRREENREYILAREREYHRAHYEANKDRYRAYGRAKSKKPRYRLILMSVLSRRRAQMIATQVEEVDFRRIIQRDGYHCYICDQAINPDLKDGPSRLVFDHVIPLARNGTHTEGNIKPAHRVCNERKNVRPLSELTPRQRRGPID